mgnify:CR=1 FL=1
MLKSLGYDPVGAGSGPEAYQFFEKTPTAFDLVVTSQVMHGMSGAELVRKLRTVRADVPVLMTVAYADDISPDDAKALGVGELIHKPIVMAQFADAIRKTLDARKPAPPPASAPPAAAPQATPPGVT